MGSAAVSPLFGDVTTSTLSDLLAAAALHQPNSTALIYGDVRLSYRELSSRVNRLGRFLIGKGVGPETVVPIAFESSIDRIVAMLGILAAGGAYLPLDVEAPPARNLDIITDSRASMVLSNVRFIDSIALSQNDLWIAIDAKTTADTLGSFDDMPILASERLLSLRKDNLAYVIYTSGSTGKPKGVCNSHGGIVTSLDWLTTTLGLNAFDICIQRAEYTFDLSVWEIFSVLVVGGTLVLLRPGGARDSTYVCDVARKLDVTLMFFVPTMLNELIECDAASDCNSIRNIVAIGETLSGHLQQKTHDCLPSVILWNGYGPTEAAVGVTLWRCRREDGASPPPIGSWAENTQIYILDGDLRPVSNGQPGDLYIAGDYLARGYLGMPELTAEKFVPCPFGPPGARMYLSGDIAERRNDGEIYFIGRNDSQIKFNGIRIELGEIEAAISALEGIARVAVISRSFNGENRLIAYVVTNPHRHELDVPRLKSELMRRIPRYLVPSFFVEVPEFPLTTSGKLDRKALPDPEVSRGHTEYREPSTELEIFFADTFAQLTGTTRVGLDESFFDLGGTSLTAMRLASRTKAKTGLVLPMRALVENPTPAALARVMDALKAGETPFTLLPFDRRPVVFVLPGAGGSDISLGEFVLACDPVLDLRILDYPDWHDLCDPGVTFQAWVDNLANLVVDVVPSGDINLTGYSLGSDVAYELAQNLRRRGRRIGFLGIIDMEAPSTRGGKASFADQFKGIAKKIGRIVHEREVGLAVMTNTLGGVPPRYLPLLPGLLSLGSRERRESIEGRMVVTVSMTLRKQWLRIASSYAPLEAPTLLFRVKPGTLDEGRFDGWWERCADVRPVQVDGNHFTILAHENVQSFVETYLDATRDILGRSRAQPGASDASANDPNGGDLRGKPLGSGAEWQSDHVEVAASGMVGPNHGNVAGRVAGSDMGVSG